MKKLIQLPDKIHDVLKNYKEKTGMSISAYIYRAIYKAMVHDKLINIKRVNIYVDKNTGKVIEKPKKKEEDKINAPPESIKYCDGDKCSVD